MTAALLIFVATYVAIGVGRLPAEMRASLAGPLVRIGGLSGISLVPLAMSSTFAGNLTLVGSLANLIVAELARAECPISFVEYLKVGIPITALTTVIGIATLVLQGA